MSFIMGFSSLVVALCKLFPDGGSCFLAQQMGHTSWDGLTHHDIIFPLFLFISGMTFPFAEINRFFLGGLAGLCPEPVGKVVFAVGYIFWSWLLLWFLYKKKVFLKV